MQEFFVGKLRRVSIGAAFIGDFAADGAGVAAARAGSAAN
jgi:hypothetical protein